MPRQKNKPPQTAPPQPGWAVYLRTSSDENQKPELSRSRQRFVIEKNVLERSEMPVFAEYTDVLSGKTPERAAYQRLLGDARLGKFSHVVVERADRFGRNDTEALRAIDELHEFGVRVVFANQPDLNPMDPDDRVIVALTFTLARRESALLGIRVKGGLHAKRQQGGYIGKAPDGYLNAEAKTAADVKKLQGRVAHWIEIDPERAPIWRLAWDLLLADRLTLAEIAEELHARGYRHRSGRPFVEVKANGQRKANISSLSNVFHNWTYAGWIASVKNNIPPKTMRGDWQPIVTTEEFERGLAILAQRNQHRSVRRKQEYLLQGMVFYQSAQGRLVRLSGSTSNAGRAGGGTAYYRVARAGGASFLCREIDTQIPGELLRIQVAPEWIPLIRQSYTHELAQKLGHIRPDERLELESALKAIDEEEARTVRLFATGKISEAIWNNLWAEWQDRRRQLTHALETLSQEREIHINNLDAALEIIANIGVLYNHLKRSDQKELLRHVVERIVVNPEGMIHLELRSPFAYLKDLTDAVREAQDRSAREIEKKVGGEVSADHEPVCSNWLQVCWGGWIRTNEWRIQSPLPYHLATPQCAQ